MIELIVCSLELVRMQQLDPNVVINLVASILTLAAAAIPFLKKSEFRYRNSPNVRFLKKSESRRRRSFAVRLFKKIISVPRGMTNVFKEKENHWTTGSFALHTSVLKALGDVDICFSCVDKDDIDPSSLNRYFR